MCFRRTAEIRIQSTEKNTQSNNVYKDHTKKHQRHRQLTLLLGGRMQQHDLFRSLCSHIKQWLKLNDNEQTEELDWAKTRIKKNSKQAGKK